MLRVLLSTLNAEHHRKLHSREILSTGDHQELLSLNVNIGTPPNARS
jgi:hypothetical protein